MQIDMHYDCNYFLARMAGLSPAMAQHIANSGQFVDDNVCKDSKIDFENDNHIKFRDGFGRIRVATAHHAKNMKNLDTTDQIQVWVPFHFYPGGLGESRSEKLVCITDGVLINEAKQHCLDLAGKSYAPFLVGIIAHVYGDTFSHYGFTGQADPINKVKRESIIFDEKDLENRWEGGKGSTKSFKKLVSKRQVEKNWNKAKAIFGDTAVRTTGDLGALGHGLASTCPDKPFLNWSLGWEEPNLRSNLPRMEQRNNPVTFLEGAEALYKFFVEFRNKIEGSDELLRSVTPPVEWSLLKPNIESVINEAGDTDYRRKKWLEMAETVFPMNRIEQGFDEAIPPYKGESWNEDWKIIKNDEGSLDRNALEGKPFEQFYLAATEHRRYTLKELLPRHGINL
ncbi:MAG: hypothetical protein OD811_03890 [Alphaproteobacteria bacterium]